MAKDKRHIIIKNDDEDDDKKKKIMIIIAIIIIILSLLSSCSCTSNFFGVIGNIFRNEGNYNIDDDPEEETIKNKELKFINDKLEISIGDSKAKLGFYYKNIKPSEFTCVTSDAEIASCYVEEDYVVINPYKVGKVTVYLKTSANGKKYEASAKVTINDSDRGIKLLETKGTINLAYEKEKNVAYTLEGITGIVTSTSSDESIAKASIENGVLKITAYKVGEVKITLNTNYNGKNYTSVYTLKVINQISTQNPTGSGSNRPGSESSGSGNHVNTDFDNDASLVELEDSTKKIVFKSSQFTYDINVGWLTSNITLRAVARYGKLSYEYKRADQSKYSAIDSLKNLKLKTGTNTVKIYVTSNDGTNKNVYTINIHKETGNYIKKIESDDIDIKFDKKIQSYKIDTEKDIIALKVTKSDKSQDVTYTFGGVPISEEELQNLHLLPGTNIIEVIAKHEDHEPRKYTININKLENGVDVNTSLSSLSTGLANEIEFNANKFEYYVPVGNNVTKFTLSAGAESDNATVTIEYNGETKSGAKNASFDIKDLKVGKNYITVKVKNGEKESAPYTIVVERADESGSHNVLTNIQVSGRQLQPEFRSEELNYKVNVGNSNKVSITATADSNSEVLYCYKDQCNRDEWTKGNKITKDDLEYGTNYIKIKVQEKNESSQIEPTIYSIEVIREGKENAVAELESMDIQGTRVNINKAATETDEVEIAATGKVSVNAIAKNNGTISYKDSNNNVIPNIEKYLEELTPGTSATITINVESNDKTNNKTYTVKVTKKVEEENPPTEEYKAEIKQPVPVCTIGTECAIHYVIYEIKDGVQNEITTNYTGEVTATLAGEDIELDTSNRGVIKFIANFTSSTSKKLTLNITPGQGSYAYISFKKVGYEFDVQSENGKIYVNVPGEETTNGKRNLIVHTDIFETRPIADTVVDENGQLKIYGEDQDNAYITISSEHPEFITLSYNKDDANNSKDLPIKIEVNQDELDKYLANNPDIKIPSFNITVGSNLYGEPQKKEVALIVARNYTLTVSAGDGIFTDKKYDDGSLDNVRIIPLERGDTYDLSSIEVPYITTTEGGENACIKISKVFKQYVDEKGNPIISIDNITSDRTIITEYVEKTESTGNDNYPTKTFWVTLDGTDEEGLFYTKQPYKNESTLFPVNSKYNKKLIYPGIEGTYTMNITNTLDSKKTIIITGVILEEQTICVETGCVNMGFAAKSGSGNKEDTCISGGVTHFGDFSKTNDSEKFIVLNSANSGNSTNSTVTVQQQKKDLQNHKGTNKVNIKFSENTNKNTTLDYKDYFEITLHWKWIETNDTLDTAIGNIAAQMDQDDNIYGIKIGIQYIEIC